MDRRPFEYVGLAAIAAGSLAAGFCKGAARAHGIGLPYWVGPAVYVGIPIAAAGISSVYERLTRDDHSIGSLFSGDDLIAGSMAKVAIDEGLNMIVSGAVGAGALACEGIGELAGYFISR